MTPKRLAEIEQRCDLATEGPWGVSRLRFCSGYIVTDQEKPPIFVPGDNSEELANIENDAAFISCARQDIPDLIAEVRRLTDELNRAQADGANACAYCENKGAYSVARDGALSQGLRELAEWDSSR